MFYSGGTVTGTVVRPSALGVLDHVECVAVAATLQYARAINEAGQVDGVTKIE